MLYIYKVQGEGFTTSFDSSVLTSSNPLLRLRSGLGNCKLSEPYGSHPSDSKKIESIKLSIFSGSRGEDSNLRRANPADLQSAPVGRLGTPGSFNIIPSGEFNNSLNISSTPGMVPIHTEGVRINTLRFNYEISYLMTVLLPTLHGRG